MLRMLFSRSSVEGETETETNPALAFQRAFVEEGNFEFVSQLHVVSILPLSHTGTALPTPATRKRIVPDLSVDTSQAFH